MIDYLKLFLANGVMGYLLQALGYMLGILAFNKKSIPLKKLALFTILTSILMFGIRSISAFSFGFHTILVMISFIVLSVLVLKMAVPQTVLAVLLTTVMILLAESLNYGLMCLLLGSGTVDFYLKSTDTLHGQINKALIGIPTNIILIAVMSVFYKIRMKKVAKKEAETSDGKNSKQNR